LTTLTEFVINAFKI